MTKTEYLQAMRLCIYGRAWTQYLNFRRDALKVKAVTGNDIRRLIHELPEDIKFAYLGYFRQLW